MGSHFGVGAPPFLEPSLLGMGIFTGGYGLLTHSHLPVLLLLLLPALQDQLFPELLQQGATGLLGRGARGPSRGLLGDVVGPVGRGDLVDVGRGALFSDFSS